MTGASVSSTSSTSLSTVQAVGDGVSFITAPVNSLLSNETVQTTSQKVIQFISNNKSWLFCAAVAIQFITAPVVCVLTFAIGYWAFDKEFLINPGEKRFRTDSLLSTTHREVACFVSTIVLRFLINPVVATVVAGFLAGCYIKKLCEARGELPREVPTT